MYVRDLAQYYSIRTAEQVNFVGDRITETAELLKNVSSKMNKYQDLVSDKGAFEWIVSAQERLAEAELQFEAKAETNEGILSSLTMVAGWADISGELITIARASKTGEVVDTSAYINKSSDMILRAEAEIGKFPSNSGFGAEWYLKIARKEYENGQYVSAFIDANIASIRLETNAELNTRGWDNLTVYVEEALASVNVSNSVWGRLYRDYGMLTLYNAEENMDQFLLKESLIYAREAKLYSDVFAEYGALSRLEVKGVYDNLLEKIVIACAIVLAVVVVISFIGKTVHTGVTESSSYTRKKRKGKRAV